jgi:hypothetical protein
VVAKIERHILLRFWNGRVEHLRLEEIDPGCLIGVCGSAKRRVQLQLTTRQQKNSHNMADVIVIDSGSESETNHDRNDEKYVVLN